MVNPLNALSMVWVQVCQGGVTDLLIELNISAPIKPRYSPLVPINNTYVQGDQLYMAVLFTCQVYDIGQ